MRSKTSHDHQRLLRHRQTEAERVLWQHLRNRRLQGWKFRRQHRVGRYITDFACLERLLVVELDGSQHLDAAEHDAARTRFLETRGFRVLRFWNDDVLRKMDGVLDAISIALAPHPPFGHLLPACGEKDMHGPACGEKDMHGSACGEKGEELDSFSASAPTGWSGRRSG